MAVEQQSSEAGPQDAPAGMAPPLLDGMLNINGPLTLSIPLPGNLGVLDVPMTLDGSTRVRIADPQAVRVDAKGTLRAPLVLAMPLPGGLGRLDADAELSGDAVLELSLPHDQGRLEARLRAIGPATLRLDLPDAGGHLSARAALNTPLTASLLLPSGQARIGAHDRAVLETRLELRPASGGSVEAAAPIEVSFSGALFLPSGKAQLQATAPFRTQLRLSRLAIPELHQALSLLLRVEGGAELTAELPDGGTQLRAYFTAALPLAPLVRLLHGELDRHVEVEQIELLTPRLNSAHELALPLLIVARRGIQASVELTVELRIDPRTKQLTLRSAHADGLNAAGRAASWLYINPRLLQGLRNTILFDPLHVLPPEARVEALGFKAAGRDELSVEGVASLEWDTNKRMES